MQLHKLTISNFQIVADADLDLSTHPLHLIAGDNRQGKSTLFEAVKYALCGSPTRVENKKSQIKALIRDGAKKASIELTAGDLLNTISLPSGEISDGIGSRDNIHLPFLLHPERFATISGDARRSYLFALTQPDSSTEVIRKKLVKAKCDPDKIEQALPLVAAGFDSAFAEVKRLASEATIGWKTLTGEAYGSVKADTWEAPKPDMTQEAVSELEAKFKAADDLRMQAHAVMLEKREAAKRIPAGYTPAHLECPACKADLMLKGELLAPHCGDGTEAVEPTPEALQALSEAQAAYDQATADTDALRNEWMAANRLLEQAQNAEAITAKAKQLHTDAVQWKEIADQYGPDGIPAELLGDALKPMNKRLRDSATATEWPQVSIQPDMSVLVDGRMYGLESESGRYRADMMLAEAISHLSGEGFLMFDRVDMLTPAGRAELVKWLNNLAMAEEINTAICLMAIKDCPKGLPANWAVHWIKNGELKAAA